MKWSVVALVMVGLLAAGSAAALVALMQHPGGLQRAISGRDSEVKVLVAADDLPIMTQLKEGMVETRTVPRSEAPAKFLSNEVQVIGDLLAVGVNKGEALTPQHFARDGSGLKLSAKLEEDGMRAVTIALSEHGALGSLLTPGCVVDVLATFKVRAPTSSREEPVASVILEGVPVLGVRDETVVSEEMEGERKTPAHLRSQRRWLVTLMVNQEQAKKLALVGQNGELSLALRNPEDRTPSTSTRPARLRGILGELGVGGSMLDAFSTILNRPAPPPGIEPETGRETTSEPEVWEMEVIKGGVPQKVILPLPAPLPLPAGRPNVDSQEKAPDP